MSTRAFAAVLLKVWGVLCLMWGTIGLANSIAEWVMQPYSSNDPNMQRFSLFLSAASTLITLGVAFVLLKYGDMVAGALVRTDDRFSFGLSPMQLEAVLLGVLGAYLAVAGFRQVAVIGYTLIRRPAWDQTGALAYVWHNQEREVAGAAIDLLAGLLLLFGRKGIAAGWARLHPMGEHAD